MHRIPYESRVVDDELAARIDLNARQAVRANAGRFVVREDGIHVIPIAALGP